MPVLFFVFYKGDSFISFVDVGQGDCAVINTKESGVMIIDMGSSDKKNVYENTVKSYLKYSGCFEMDSVIVSHFDEDHISGIMEMLEEMRPYSNSFSFYKNYDGSLAVKNLYLPKEIVRSDKCKKMVDLANGKNVNIFFVEKGFEINGEGISARCLYPEKTEISANENSLAFLVETDKYIALFMGDADRKAENRITGEMEKLTYDNSCEKICNSEKIKILKVSHHGSKTSSSKLMLDFYKPDYSVISCGKKNRYGHPHEETLETLLKTGTLLLRTDEKGTICFN